MIRHPGNVAQTRARLNRVESNLVNILGRQPNDDELACASGMSADTLSSARGAARVSVSLEYGVDEDSTDTLGDMQQDVSTLSPEEETLQSEVKDELELALGRLSAREATVIRRRYLSPWPLSFGELGDLLGISRERVRQIEQAALAKLRQNAGLAAYM
jgi:RNA polymerase primary sigma factor